MRRSRLLPFVLIALTAPLLAQSKLEAPQTSQKNVAQSLRAIVLSRLHAAREGATGAPIHRPQASTGSGLAFAPAVPYASGGADAFSVAVADLNGDGKPDIVVANGGSCSGEGSPEASVGVLLGNGNGTFHPAVSYGTGGSCVLGSSTVAIADVNGDGKPDIVVANDNGSVGVLLGNGDGTFQTAVTWGSGGYGGATSVAVADVNGDGKPDLIVANECLSSSDCSSGSAAVLLGNGDGSFQPAVSYGSGGSYAFSLAVADVNGDHKPDILVTNYFSNSVGVLLGNGNGSFQPAVAYPSGGSSPDSVAVRDVNGDGKPDLVVANFCTLGNGGCGDTDAPAGVLLGNGNGTFRPVVTYDSGGHFDWSVAVADVNGDGKPDVLTTGNFTTDVGVLPGNGNGTFQPAVTFETNRAISVAAADVNGDGKPDLIVAGYDSAAGYDTVDVLVNTGATTFYTLLDATKEDVSRRVPAEIMVATLELARDTANQGDQFLADLLLNAFVDEVRAAEADKAVTPANAAILIEEADSLRQGSM